MRRTEIEIDADDGLTENKDRMTRSHKTLQILSVRCNSGFLRDYVEQRLLRELKKKHIESASHFRATWVYEWKVTVSAEHFRKPTVSLRRKNMHFQAFYKASL